MTKATKVIVEGWAVRQEILDRIEAHKRRVVPSIAAKLVNMYLTRAQTSLSEEISIFFEREYFTREEGEALFDLGVQNAVVTYLKDLSWYADLNDVSVTMRPFPRKSDDSGLSFLRRNRR